MKKIYAFFINGHHIEDYKTLAEAKQALQREMRVDFDEVYNQGYLPLKPHYYIKEVKP